MLHSFTIENFRCFQDFAIKPLERINLIAGKNNVGKTALIEGMFLFAGATNPQLPMSINVFRGIEVFELKPELLTETPWNSLFLNFDENKMIALSGIDVNGKSKKERRLNMKIERKESELVMKRVPDREKEGFILSELTGKTLELTYTDESKKVIKSKLIIEGNRIRVDSSPVPVPYNAIFMAARTRISAAEDAQRYSNIEIVGQQEVLLDILKLIEPKLKRLTIVVNAGVPMIFGDIGLDRLVPLPIMGDGMARVCSLVLAIANSQNGIVFIDEIENGIHHSIMEKIWTGIAEAARRFNTQVVATTHSRECIVSAYSAFNRSERYDFLFHRLERGNGKIEAKTYDKETLEAAIETGFEVR